MRTRTSSRRTSLQTHFENDAAPDVIEADEHENTEDGIKAVIDAATEHFGLKVFADKRSSVDGTCKDLQGYQQFLR